MKKNDLVFVVHKHDATRLHYDFRLEIGGVMPSWAIPKGPTLDPAHKRLAMQTTDHDLSYRHFEGILPEGSYGAGPVMIWDEGTYAPEVEISKGKREAIADTTEGERVMKEGLRKGELKFFLHGKKLRGSFALIKTKNFGPKNAWLLIKHTDQFVKKHYDANAHDISAVSKKTLSQIATKKK